VGTVTAKKLAGPNFKPKDSGQYFRYCSRWN
jgi:hypothetical protein